MIEAWEVKLFGGLTARKKQSAVTRFRTGKTGSLFAYLLCHSNNQNPRELIIASLWPNADAAAGRNSLRVALHSLRNQLEIAELDRGMVLQVDGQYIGINKQTVHSDFALFQQSIKLAAHARSIEEKVSHSGIAANLYSGELLSGYQDEWIIPIRSACAEQYLETLQVLAQYHKMKEDWYSCLVYAQRAMQADPFSEDIQLLLIETYAALGKHDQAKKQVRNYKLYSQKEEMEGVSPEFERHVKNILLHYKSAKTVLQPAKPAEEAALPEIETSIVDNNHIQDNLFTPKLPAIATRFFGRKREIIQIQNVMRSEHARLLTITGLGGTGKTRLMVEAARELTDFFNGCVWFVVLSELKDPALILDAILAAIGLERNRTEASLPRLIELLKDRPALLVLDNFEQLLLNESDSATARNAIIDLLEQLPFLKCLVSSRISLEIQGENYLPIQPLPFPPDQSQADDLTTYPSIQLFLDRAKSIKPDFALTKKNAEAISSLCARLEGIPLAIELAATRAQVLTPNQMLLQLEDRYQFLINSGSQFPERHRSLFATIQWSYDLLPAAIQQFFLRLSVFKGDWSIKSAKQVCANGWDFLESSHAGLPAMAVPEHDVVGMLDVLHEKSLITVHEYDDEMRYGMLETIREFADDKLQPAAREALKLRFAEHYMHFVEEMGPLAHGSGSKRDLDTLELEYDNIICALDWTFDADSPEIGLRMICSLIPFWPVRRSASAALEKAVRLLSLCAHIDSPWKLTALGVAGDLAKEVGQYELAKTFYQQEVESRKRSGHLGPIMAQYALGKIALLQNSYREALEWYEAYYQQVRDTEHIPTVAYVECEIAFVHMLLGEFNQAADRCSHAVETCLVVEDKYISAYAFHMLGSIYMRMGNYSAARDNLQKCLIRREERDDKAGIAATYRNYGRICAYLGEPDKGIFMLRSALKYYQDNNNDIGICDNLEGFIEHWTACRKYELAVRADGALSSLRERCLDGLLPCDLSAHNSRISFLRMELGQSVFDEHWQNGRNMSTHEIVNLALYDAP